MRQVSDHFSRIVVLFICVFSFQILLSQEQQVEFVPKIKQIDSELARDIGVFEEYEGFDEARLFQRGDSSFVLEIYTLRNGQTLRDRVQISEEELAALRQKIRSAISEKPSLAGLNQRGRPHIIAGSIPLGLYYGSSLGVLLSDKGGRFVAAAPLLVGGGLTVTSILSTRDKEVTYAMGSMALNGGFMGLGHGALIQGLSGTDHLDGETFLGVSSLTSITEGWIFYAIARKNDFSPGRAALWNYGNFWGTSYGIGLAAFLGGEDVSLPAVSAGGLIGSGLGIWAGQSIYRNTPHTPGNIAGVSNLTALGGLVGGTLASIADFDGTRSVTGSLLGFASLGSFAGFSMMKKHRFNNTQGWYLTLGNIGGLLAGGGISVLTGVEGGTSGLITAAGGLAGFLTVYHMIKDEDPARDGLGFLGIKGVDGLSVDLNPLSLFQEQQKSAPFPTLQDVRSNSVLHLNYKF